MKHITVFGANGKVGSLVVQGLLERGHTVTAFVRNASGMESHENLKIVEGDIYDPESVGRAVEGADAVISSLGSWGTPKKDILSVGMKHLIPAMKLQGVDRIISLTGAEARATGDHLGVIHRMAHVGAKLAAGKILLDGEFHIRQLEQSGLNWTVIRSPIMNESGTAHYVLRSKRPRPWATINRQAVADAMVQQLNDSHFAKTSPFISR